VVAYTVNVGLSISLFIVRWDYISEPPVWQWHSSNRD